MTKTFRTLFTLLPLAMVLAVLPGWKKGPAFLGPVPWSHVPVCCAGFVTGMDMAANGIAVTRTDVYGAYLLDTTQGNSGSWIQLVDQSRFNPSEIFINNQTDGLPGGFLDAGVFEIKIAPSNTSLMYMVYGSGLNTAAQSYMFISTNGGASWAQLTGLGAIAANAANGNQVGLGVKSAQGKMAIDPVNADNVFVSTESTNGVLHSTTASTIGGSWASVVGNGLPAASNTANPTAGIVFDATTSSGGLTQTLYATPMGQGTYCSTDNGTTWTHINTGGPATLFDAKMATSNPADANAHVLYGMDGTNNVWRHTGGCVDNNWTSVGLANLRAIAVDPTNSNRIVAIGGTGQMYVSTNAGTSFTFSAGSKTNVGTAATGSFAAGATTINLTNTTGCNSFTANTFVFDNQGSPQAGDGYLGIGTNCVAGTPSVLTLAAPGARIGSVGATDAILFSNLKSTNIPWFWQTYNTGSLELTPTAMFFDRNNNNKLWFSGSAAAWNVDISGGISSAALIPLVTQGVEAHEELVVQEIVVPPGYSPIGGHWDYMLTRLDNPAAQRSKMAISLGTWGFCEGASLDWAGTAPNVVAFSSAQTGCGWETGLSSDAGVTWSILPNSTTASNTSGNQKGTSTTGISYGTQENNTFMRSAGIALTDASHVVVQGPVGAGAPWYTADGGANWHSANFAPDAISSITGNGTWSAGATSIPVSTCVGVPVGARIWDTNSGAGQANQLVGFVGSCSGGNITLSGPAAAIASAGSNDTLYMTTGVPPDVFGVTAGSTPPANGVTTFTVSSCAGIYPGMAAYLTSVAGNNALIGSLTTPAGGVTVSKCAGTTVTLTGASTVNGVTGDTLFFTWWVQNLRHMTLFSATNWGRWLTADKVNANTFYSYVSGGSGAGNNSTPTRQPEVGLWKSTDGGANWTNQNNIQLVIPGSQFQMKAVPGIAGDILMTMGNRGNAGHPATNNYLFFTPDGGTTMTAVTSMREPSACGVGKAKAGGYPTIYCAGYASTNGGVSYSYNIWQSVNFNPASIGSETWTALGPYPQGTLSTVTTITGDMNDYGAVYLGTHSNGYFWGRFPN